MLNIKHKGKETVQDQGVVTDIYDTNQGKVELLEAIGEDTPIGKFLTKLLFIPGCAEPVIFVLNMFLNEED